MLRRTIHFARREMLLTRLGPSASMAIPPCAQQLSSNPFKKLLLDPLQTPAKDLSLRRTFCNIILGDEDILNPTPVDINFTITELPQGFKERFLKDLESISQLLNIVKKHLGTEPPAISGPIKKFPEAYNKANAKTALSLKNHLAYGNFESASICLTKENNSGNLEQCFKLALYWAQYYFNKGDFQSFAACTEIAQQVFYAVLPPSNFAQLDDDFYSIIKAMLIKKNGWEEQALVSNLKGDVYFQANPFYKYRVPTLATCFKNKDWTGAKKFAREGFNIPDFSGNDHEGLERSIATALSWAQYYRDEGNPESAKRCLKTVNRAFYRACLLGYHWSPLLPHLSNTLKPHYAYEETGGIERTFRRVEDQLRSFLFPFQN